MLPSHYSERWNILCTWEKASSGDHQSLPSYKALLGALTQGCHQPTAPFMLGIQYPANNLWSCCRNSTEQINEARYLFSGWLYTHSYSCWPSGHRVRCTIPRNGAVKVKDPHPLDTYSDSFFFFAHIEKDRGQALTQTDLRYREVKLKVSISACYQKQCRHEKRTSDTSFTFINKFNLEYQE